MNLPRDLLVYFAAVLMSAAAATWLCAHGFPCPRTDDAVYKSPAAEYVQNGRLAIPCMAGFLPGADQVFAAYPPGYQLLLAGWYKLFGFSLGSSIAFCQTLHLLNMAAVIAIARRLLLVQMPDLQGWLRATVTASTGLLYFFNLAYFDRPEEAGLLWLWAELFFYLRLSHTVGKHAGCLFAPMASGVLIGLAALTAPWVGVLAATAYVVRTCIIVGPCWRRGYAWGRLGAALFGAGFASAAIVAAWVVVIEKRHPGALEDQFFGTMRFLAKTQGKGPLQDRLSTFLRSALLYNIGPFPMTATTAFFFPAAMRQRKVVSSPGVGAAVWSVYLTGVASICAVAVLRPPAYTYLGASMLLMIPCFAPAIARFLLEHRSKPKLATGLFILACCLGVASQKATGMIVATLRLPAEERANAVFRRLCDSIPPGESVAVTCRHWYPFQGRNPWREANFASLTSPHEIYRCQWLVLPARRSRLPYSIKAFDLDAFVLVEEIHTEADRSNTYAFSLWRRKTSLSINADAATSKR